ncbi:MAG: VOC family protein [Defluviitaleaceae bacterium]|nr:VOC family protein [Defluviitaleaceae bacterium]
MINGINHITISVKDIDSAFSFYRDILALKPVMKSNHSAYFRAGKVWIALVQEKNFEKSRNYAHIAFNVPQENYTDFVKTLRINGVKEWQKNDSEGESLYILDDSGNKLEIHFSSLEKRAAHGKNNWGDGYEWFI